MVADICPDCGSPREPETCSFCLGAGSRFQIEQPTPGTAYRVTGRRQCEHCNGTGIANPCRQCSYERVMAKLGWMEPRP